MELSGIGIGTDQMELSGIGTDQMELTPYLVLDMEKIVLSLFGASCVQDLIPTWILKQCKDELLPTIKDIINRSLSSGKFPNSTKNPLVKPLLNKSPLDPSEYKNYRSDLYPRLSKGSWLTNPKSYFYANSLDDELQVSLQNKIHNSETIILKVVSDIQSQTWDQLHFANSNSIWSIQITHQIYQFKFQVEQSQFNYMYLYMVYEHEMHNHC